MFIVIVSTQGRQIVFAVRNSDDPNRWSPQDAKSYIEKRWGTKMQGVISSIRAVPSDGYPYYV